ncbi:hypothetical protein AQUCO_04300126v1 [Aquilegia coerulea]|uniref:Cytochrome P450 n=1 Tax=Aquilegia coerulea TaxID=218851 RepID=A0A2G5CNU3_AQUCA|nr:hypothetical protein AQUCO_04300126v1 [Aquilegia coerulea]
MVSVLFSLLVVFSVLVCSCAWAVLNWIWLKPMKAEKFLREQGIRGPPYRLGHGNTKEIATLMEKELSKPMELSNRIVPRLLPFVQQMAELYGKTFVYWEGPTPTVATLDPELLRDIFNNKFGNIEKKRANPLVDLVAEGVERYEGEKWVKHRKIINPAFHIKKLKMMVPAFHACSSEMISKWQKLVTEDSKEIDVWPDIQNLAADGLSRTAFGSSYEEGRRIFQLQTEQIHLIIESAQSVYIPGLRFLPTKINKRMKETHKEVGTILREMIIKREKALKLGEESKDDLLDILLESNFEEIKHGGNAKNAGMTINEVIEECKLFYLAGQETSSTLLVWTMVLLTMHPKWQEKARAEVLEVFGKRNPDFEGLNQLKIVTMILYEVLRLYPPIPSLARITNKKIKVGEVSLPPGTQIVLPTLLVHHDPELWGEDADEFKPERFFEGIAKATSNRTSFFPFGWGPRICVGQTFALIEVKVALAMILQNFSFELSPTYTHAPYTIATIQPQYGAQFILHNL